MAHVLVLHAPVDYAVAGAVAAVLHDLTAFRVELTPERRPWRFGPNVVALAIYTVNTPTGAYADVLGEVLSSANGRAVAFCFGSAELPETLARHCQAVIRETGAPSNDQTYLRAAIMQAISANLAPSSIASATQLKAASELERESANHRQQAKNAPPRPRRGAIMLLIALLLAAAGMVGVAVATGGFNELESLAEDLSGRVKRPQMTESFDKAKSAGESNQSPTAEETASGSTKANPDPETEQDHQ